MANSEPPTPHFPGWYPPTPGTPASDTFSTKDGSAVGTSSTEDDLPAFVGQDLSVDSTKPQKFNYEQGGILDEAGRRLAAGGAVGAGAGALAGARDSERTPTEEKVDPVHQTVGLGLADVQTEDPTATNGDPAAVSATNGAPATATASSEVGAKEDEEKPASALSENAGSVAAALGGATAAIAGALGVKSYQEKELEGARAIESGDSARASGAGAESSLLPAPASSSLATQPISEASSTLADTNKTEPEPITTSAGTSAAPAVGDNHSHAGPLAAVGAAALGAGALGSSGFQDHELQEARAHEAEEVAAEGSGAHAQPASSLEPSAPIAAGNVQPAEDAVGATTSAVVPDEQVQPTATADHDKSSTFVPAAAAGAALAGVGTAAILAHDGSESTPKAITQPLPSTTETAAPATVAESSTPAQAPAASATETKTPLAAANATSPSKSASPSKDGSPKDSSPKPKEKSALKSALAAVGIGRKDKDKKSKADDSAEVDEKVVGEPEAKEVEKSGEDSNIGKAAVAGGALAGAGAVLAGQHGDELVAQPPTEAQAAAPVVQQSDAPISRPTLSNESKDVVTPTPASVPQTAALAAAAPSAVPASSDSKASDSLPAAPVQQQQPTSPIAPNMDAAKAAALAAHNAALAQYAPHALPINQIPSSPGTNDATATALAAHNSALATHAPHAVGDNNVIAGQSPAFPPAGQNVEALSGAGSAAGGAPHPARIDQLRAGGADGEGGYKHGKAIIHYGAPGTETDVGHRPDGLRKTDSFVSDFPGGPVRRPTEDGADSNSSTQALVGTPVNEAHKELSLDTADEKKRISSPLAAAAIGGTAGSAAALAAAHEHNEKEGGAGSVGHTARKLSRKRKSVIRKDDDAATALASQRAEEDARRQRENEAKRDVMFATMGAGRDPTVGKPSSPKQSSVFSHSRPGSTGGPASVASLDTTGARDSHSPGSASPRGNKRHSVLRRHHGTSESGASDASGGSGTDLKKQDHSGHHVTQPFPSSDAGDSDRKHRRTTSVGSAAHTDGYTSDGTRSRKNTLKRRSHYESIAREHEEQLRHERDTSSATAVSSSDADRRTANSSSADTEVESESGVEGGKRKKKGSLFKRIFSRSDKEKTKEAEVSAQ